MRAAAPKYWRKMFRPCIDVRGGRVVQLEQGARLALTDARAPVEIARLYERDHLEGGHVIDLDGGANKSVILPALRYAKLQVGGGIRLENGREYLEAGAAQLIFSSAVFKKEGVDWDHLAALARAFGRERLVLAPDVREQREIWVQQWKAPTGLRLTARLLRRLARYCAAFLVHSIEVEGLEGGVDWSLARFLARTSPIPVVYAGGCNALETVRRLHDLGLDVTIGKAYFAGRMAHGELVALNRRLQGEGREVATGALTFPAVSKLRTDLSPCRSWDSFAAPRPSRGRRQGRGI